MKSNYGSAKYIVSFKGGEKEAGAAKKTGKFFKGLGTATVDSYNPAAASSITTKTDVWQVKSVDSNGTTRLLYESGGFRTGAGITERDPGAIKAKSDLDELVAVLDLAKAEIAKAQKAGQQIEFDPNTNRSQRSYMALQDATKSTHLDVK